MIIKNITQVGNPIIRAKSKPVKSIKSKGIKRIIKNIADSMRYANLVGMAAPQIGINKRIFLTEIRKTPTRKMKSTDALRVFINPRIVVSSKKTWSAYEGCGSVAKAGLLGKVRRPLSVTVKAYNQKGDPFELKAKGWLARIIQHEMDHLDGRVFLDRLTDTKSLMSTNEYIKRVAKKEK